jgi:hypothetical protein
VQLHHAADLVPELDTTVARQARFGELGPRSRGRAPAAPIRPGGDQDDQATGWAPGLVVNLAAAEDRDAVVNTVGGWCRVVVEERYGGSPPSGPVCLECYHPSCVRLHAWRRWMPPPTTLADTMRWLAGQLDWARYQRWAAEALDELGYATRLVERTVDRPGVRTRIVVGPCPEIVAGGVACGGEVVAIVPARETRPAVMRCQICGAQWPTMQWARAGRRILAQKNREAA